MIVFFGIGNTANKTINRYKISPDFFVDNSEAVWDTEWNGYSVKKPDSLLEEDIERIVICTTSYRSVFAQLRNMGIDMEKVEVTRVLDSVVAADRIESVSFDLLFVSGIPSHESNFEGGGVYRLKGDLSGHKLTKIYAGNCHGIVYDDDLGIIVSDTNNGILFLDESFNVKKRVKVPSELRPHGCAVVDGCSFLLACSYDDSVIHFDLSGKEIRRYGFSNAIKRFGIPKHHVNDVCFHEGYIYASMFSISGAWQSGFLDGGIVRVDIESGEQATVLDGLTMPHNIRVSNDGYLVCNSYESTLLTNNRQIRFRGNGFLRGLCDTKKYWIVAESKNRNFANIDGGPLNPCLDSRINFVDKQSSAYISVQLPFGVTEIHSILSVLDIC